MKEMTSGIDVSEFCDGELFCFTEIIDDEQECEMWFDRKCGKEILVILSKMLGEESCPESK